jgi:hypothetical protein
MKKTYYLLLFVLLLSAAAKAQTNWVTNNLDDKMSVKFPVVPKKTTTNGIDVYTVRMNDSLAYSATMIDYNVLVHLDSAAIAPVKDKQQFADQLRMGMASKKTNYTFGAITIGKWNTYTAYNMSAIENTSKNTLWVQAILIGSKMYTLSCRVPANMVTKNNEVFFASPQLLKK